jgi:hypothetical protein
MNMHFLRVAVRRAARVQALEGVDREGSCAFDLLRLRRWTTNTHAKEYLASQDVKRPSNRISDPERLVAQARYPPWLVLLFVRLLALFPVLALELCSPVIPWSRTFVVR